MVYDHVSFQVAGIVLVISIGCFGFTLIYSQYKIYKSYNEIKDRINGKK